MKTANALALLTLVGIAFSLPSQAAEPPRCWIPGVALPPGCQTDSPDADARFSYDERSNSCKNKLGATGLNPVAQNPDPECSFSDKPDEMLNALEKSRFAAGAELANMNLSGISSLRGYDFRGADLTHALFSETHCSPFHCDENKTDLSVAILKNAKLKQARLQGVSMVDALLNNADLTTANLLGAVLDGADLRGADLTGVLFHSDRAELLTSFRTAIFDDDTKLPFSKADAESKYGMRYGK